MPIGGVEVLDSDAAVVGGGVVHREVLIEAAPDASLGKIPALTHRPGLQWRRRWRACGRLGRCRRLLAGACGMRIIVRTQQRKGQGDTTYQSGYRQTKAHDHPSI